MLESSTIGKKDISRDEEEGRDGPNVFASANCLHSAKLTQPCCF